MGKEFDLFFSAEDFYGNPGRLFYSDDGAGTTAGFDVDNSGFFSYSIQNSVIIIKNWFQR